MLVDYWRNIEYVFNLNRINQWYLSNNEAYHYPIILLSSKNVREAILM